METQPVVEGGDMPLVRIDLVEGKSEEYREKVGEIVYQTLVDILPPFMWPSAGVCLWQPHRPLHDEGSGRCRPKARVGTSR